MSQLSNLDKWRAYMDGFVSPDSFIDFGFFYLINASLQRRVWCGPEHAPCYPNIYVVFVSDPSVGKGLVIKQVANVIKSFKLEDPRQKLQQPLSKDADKTEKTLAETIQKADYDAAMELEKEFETKTKDAKMISDKPLLIPVAADATTYEALVRSMARSFRSLQTTKFNEQLGKMVPDIYSHSSLCFCLEEIASLFRKKTEDLIHFLLQTYDCGDYTYDTKSQGKDKIRFCCLNFLGGTQPSFMQQSFNDALINEGFSSRTFFIFASKNRKRPFWIPPLTEVQKQYYKDILSHVEKLTKLYGHVTFDKEANDLLESWWEKADTERPNTNPKLIPYYGRKKVHVLKLALADHFSDSLEMTVRVGSVQRTLERLASEEKKMHFCLGLDSSNPLALCSRKVQKYILNMNGKGVTFKELTAEFWEALPGTDQTQSMRDILDHLKLTNQIDEKDELHSMTKQKCRFYYAMKESEI